MRNAASIALVERLGFERRATRRSDDVIGGARGLDHEYVLRIAEAERQRLSANRPGMSEKPARRTTAAPPRTCCGS